MELKGRKGKVFVSSHNFNNSFFSPFSFLLFLLLLLMKNKVDCFYEELSVGIISDKYIPLIKEPKTCNRLKHSPIMVVLSLSFIKGNRYETIRRLLELGANVNLSDVNGLSPLHIACGAWTLGFKYVMDEEETSCQSSYYDFTTSYYKQDEREALVKLLLTYGADYTKYSTFPLFTPAYIAKINGMTKIELLLDTLVKKHGNDDYSSYKILFGQSNNMYPELNHIITDYVGGDLEFAMKQVRNV